MMVLGQYRAVMADIWWHWGGTGWYLVILGQYNLVIIGIEWYWVKKKKTFMPVYIEKNNGDVNRPTGQI